MTYDAVQILQDYLAHRRTARALVFRRTNLRGVDLGGLRADSLDLEEADLRESALTQVNWKGCILRDARLDAADCTDAVFRLCDLDQARLHNAILVRARLENSSARGARFDGADLTGAVLTDTDFSRASLRGANLEGVSASGADFRGADLRGARLQDAVLVDTDLRGADLTDADLRGVDLRGADLRGAVGGDAALPKDEAAWGELPAELQTLSETLTPIVLEMLQTAGQQGVIAPETAKRLIEEAERYRSASSRNAPSPDTLQAVPRVLDVLGDDMLPALLGALRQPHEGEPPPEVKTMILQLREAFALHETATAEDVLERLKNGSGRSPR